MSPEEIVAKFAEALEQFEPVVGQPTDSDLNRIREVLVQILLVIPYDEAEGIHNLIGLIEEDGKYQAAYTKPFVRPTKLPIYDSAIPEDAKAVVRARMEAEHKAKRQDHVTCETAEREAREFVLNVVEDTWVRELKDDSTFYAKVRAKKVLQHLQGTCTGLHALDVLALQNEMQQYHLEAEGIPEYINLLEDAQKKATRAGNPITDATVVIIATNAMLGTEQFPRANDDWEEMDPSLRSWTAWKKLYKTADRKARTKQQATGRKPAGAANAGAANAATEQPGDMGPLPETERLAPAETFGMAELDGYFDHLAAATTTEKAVLEELVGTNATLTKTNEELVAVVKKMTTENKLLQNENNSLRKKLTAATVAGTPAGTAPSNTRRVLEERKCPHCKKMARHFPSSCYELEKNASKRPAGWVSCL